MFNIVLFEPEIPPNTGNIIRLCANTGSQLHLIQPLGFELDDKRMRRAGLDYAEWATIKQYDSWSAYRAQANDEGIFALTTKATRCYSDVAFQPGANLVFGPETRGLPTHILEEIGSDNCLRIPMQENSRSLNLSNSAALVLYEAWRQHDFGAGR